MIINGHANSPEFIKDISDGLASVSFSQLGEDCYITKFFAKRDPGFYVDVGCFHPRRYSNTYLLRQYMGWRGINIDANPDVIKEFDKDPGNNINVHAAVDEVEREVELVIYKGAAHSTIDDERKKVNESLDIRYKLTVQTQTLEKLIDKNVDKSQKIDFVDIDVEGVDLQVLRSLNINRFKPSLICVEDHEFLRSINNSKPSEIFEYMRSQGYKLASQFQVSSFYIR